MCGSLRIEGREGVLMSDFSGLVTSENLELARLLNKARNKDRAQAIRRRACEKVIPAKKLGGVF
jgi:hypothetical protein